MLPSVAFTKNKIKSSKTLASAEAEGEAETLDEGLADPEGDSDGETEADADAEGESDADGELLGLGDGDSDGEGDSDAEGEREAEDEWVPPSSPSSFSAWPQERVSTVFLMSMLLRNLLEPLIPLSEYGLMPPSQLLCSKTGIVQ